MPILRLLIALNYYHGNSLIFATAGYGNYIADFACLEYKLIIELDGKNPYIQNLGRFLEPRFECSPKIRIDYFGPFLSVCGINSAA